ncbi:hypothetical protein AB0C74_02175 [Spirillospora sp. NPDC048832]
MGIRTPANNLSDSHGSAGRWALQRPEAGRPAEPVDRSDTPPTCTVAETRQVA